MSDCVGKASSPFTLSSYLCNPSSSQALLIENVTATASACGMRVALACAWRLVLGKAGGSCPELQQRRAHAVPQLHHLSRRRTVLTFRAVDDVGGSSASEPVRTSVRHRFAWIGQILFEVKGWPLEGKAAARALNRVRDAREILQQATDPSRNISQIRSSLSSDHLREAKSEVEGWRF